LIPNEEKLFVLGVNDGVSVYDYNSGKFEIPVLGYVRHRHDGFELTAKARGG